MPATSRLFTAKSAPRPSGTSQRLRSLAFLSAAVLMLCLYKFILIPRIAKRTGSGAEPYLHMDEPDPVASRVVGGTPAKKGKPPQGRSSEGGGSSPRQGPGGSGSKQPGGPNRAAKQGGGGGAPAAAAAKQPPVNSNKASAQKASLRGQHSEEQRPPAAAKAAVTQQKAVASKLSPLLPPQSEEVHKHESQVPEAGAAASVHPAAARHRHGRKEELLDADMAKASSVVDALKFPKTPKWTKRVKRVVVSNESPDNKNAKHLNPKMLPDHDIPENKHSTCAVIGNGGVMLSKKWGPGIDLHDAVFRFNDGPTVGFEANVGSKTTYRLINNKWTHAYSHKHPKGATEENIILFGHGSANLGGALAKVYPRENVIFMAPEFAGAARGQYKTGQAALSQMGVIKVHGRNSAPTGIEGIFMALAVCQKVHLYGFGIEPDSTVPYHYHDKVRGVEAAHSFGFQALLLKLLNYKGIFGLCVPGHDTDDCMDPRTSDLSEYDTAVRDMAAAADADPHKDQIAAAEADGDGEDGEEEGRRR